MTATTSFNNWFARWWKNLPNAGAKNIAQQAYFQGWDDGRRDARSRKVKA